MKLLLWILGVQVLAIKKGTEHRTSRKSQARLERFGGIGRYTLSFIDIFKKILVIMCNVQNWKLTWLSPRVFSLGKTLVNFQPWVRSFQSWLLCGVENCWWHEPCRVGPASRSLLLNGFWLSVQSSFSCAWHSKEVLLVRVEQIYVYDLNQNIK